MGQSLFIAIPKIEETLKCNKYRTVSKMNDITKIFLRVVITRIRNKLRPEIPEEQYGFPPGRGTANAIFALRTLAENVMKVQKNLFLCFIDYEKAFDRDVDLEKSF